MSDLPEKVTLNEAGEFLKCSADTVREMLERGQLPGLKLEDAWVIPRVAFFEEVNRMALREAARRSAGTTGQTWTESWHGPLAGSVSPTAMEAGASRAEASTWSKRDQVVEEYSHAGMTISIYRNAGRKSPPTFFAVVTNPNVANPTGGVLGDGTDVAAIRKLAEARAERKAFLLARKIERERLPPSGRNR